MKYLILSLLFNFNLFAASGIPSGGGTAILNNTVTIGGRVINLSNPNVKIVVTHHNTAGTYTSARIVSSTPVFALVPAGKNWLYLAGTLHQSATDRVNVGWNTTGIEDDGSGGAGDIMLCGTNLADSQNPYQCPSDSPCDFIPACVVPSGKYPMTRHGTAGGGGTTTTLYLLERDN